MVGIAVGGWVDHVGHPVAGGGAEEGIHGVEDLPGNYHVPFPEEAASVLSFLTCRGTKQCLYLPSGHVWRINTLEKIQDNILRKKTGWKRVKYMWLIEREDVLMKATSLTV